MGKTADGSKRFHVLITGWLVIAHEVLVMHNLSAITMRPSVDSCLPI